MGFERHYGFLQGDANHWAPNLVCDNHYVEAPRRPEEGYHLSEDLADQAIRMVRDQQQGAPGKPFFLYFAARRHAFAPPRGARMGRALPGAVRPRLGRLAPGGLRPPGRRRRRPPTAPLLTDRPTWVEGWDELTADERRMHAPPAGGVRRLPHPHRRPDRSRSWPRSRRPDSSRTPSSWSSPTTGPVPKGGKDGSVNEHRFTAHVRESLADNLAAYDDWGGFSTYNHYSWAWAWAGNTPHKLWKRYTWLGGTRTPLIVHWPGRVAEPGTVSAPSSRT